MISSDVRNALHAVVRGEVRNVIFKAVDGVVFETARRAERAVREAVAITVCNTLHYGMVYREVDEAAHD